MTGAVQEQIEIRARSEGVQAVTEALDRLVKVRERDEAAVERIAKAYDVEYRAARQLADAQTRLERARAAGLSGTQAYQRAVEAVQKAQAASSLAVNDNATAIGLNRMQMMETIHVAKSFVDQIIAGQSPLRAIAIEGGRIGQIFSSGTGGVGDTLRGFGAVATKAFFSPLGAAAAFTGALTAIKLAGDSAAESLSTLGAKSRETGLSPATLTGAKIAGARAGLGEEEAVGAFANASKQFEQFGRNSGAVKDYLEKVDKGFLGVADKARTAAQWIDVIERKIRDLPRAQGLELSKALFGDDAGRKFFDDIERGALSMAALTKEASNAGGNFGAIAEHADKMKRQIAEAEQIASTKLLSVFGDLAEPSLAIAGAWANTKIHIADAVKGARELFSAPALRRAQQQSEGTLAGAEIGRMLTKKDPFAGKSFSDVDPLINLFTEGKGPAAVGEDRKLFETTKHNSKSDAQRATERYDEIKKAIEDQIALLSSEGDAHDQVSLKIKIENEQRKLGSAATSEMKDEIGRLVTRLEEEKGAHEKAAAAAKQYDEAFKEVGGIAKDSLKEFLHDLQKGESLSKSLRDTWKSFQTKVQDKAVDNLANSLFGGGGNDSGGLIGGLFSGKSGGALSGLFPSGGLANLFGGSSGGTGYFSGGSLFSGSSFSFGFADGGVMTSRGPVPLRRYAAGGVASAPQMALFGEGSRPEAYVPLPDGRRIPVAMDNPAPDGPGAPNITIHNYAAGVDVTPQVTPQGVALIVRSAIDANNRQNAEASWRGNRR